VDIAKSLQRMLESFARPFYRARSMRVFRDSTNLAANPDLWQTIENALDASRTLVLLTSPDAARSPWIEREVSRFVSVHGRDRVCIVRTRGTLPWLDDERTPDRVRVRRRSVVMSPTSASYSRARGAQVATIGSRSGASATAIARRGDASFESDVARDLALELERSLARPRRFGR
jgi:hypothetical protein